MVRECRYGPGLRDLHRLASTELTRSTRLRLPPVRNRHVTSPTPVRCAGGFGTPPAVRRSPIGAGAVNPRHVARLATPMRKENPAIQLDELCILGAPRAFPLLLVVSGRFVTQIIGVARRFGGPAANTVKPLPQAHQSCCVCDGNRCTNDMTSRPDRHMTYPHGKFCREHATTCRQGAQV